jgi:hypothetical protein
MLKIAANGKTRVFGKFRSRSSIPREKSSLPDPYSSYISNTS